MPSDDADSESFVDSVRRTVLGPTDAERVAELKDAAREDPESISADDFDAIEEFLDSDDAEIVGDALSVAAALTDDRSDAVAQIMPAIASVLTDRPREEWASTTLGDADRRIMNDLLAGSVLLELAETDPDYVDDVADDLAERTAGSGPVPSPHASFAAAHVAAERDVGVPDELFIELLTETIRSEVESSDGPHDQLSLTIGSRDGKIDLLGRFGDPKAVETLEYVRDHADDDAVVEAAREAIDGIER